ncbi:MULTISPECIES: alpha/beta hydrolase family protein [Flavobacteriaceae]|uniref:alpha/beta hydrolase family protein n=1 Tax=Flavobacteriaceae TaxID=49546 RepID=UPI001490EACA|nr:MULTISPECIES: acetylxylan esterase [Allomuricauda]MDC6366824.1 acetylxylan esterase [Muricauda sp. AC10]
MAQNNNRIRRLGWTVLLLPQLILAQVSEFRITRERDQENNMSCYLGHQAERISGESLSAINTIADWKAVRQQRKDQLLEMLGLEDKYYGKRSPLNVKLTGVIQQKGFRIEKLYYESLPGLYVPANLYIPENKGEKMPAILFVCGHAHTQKHHYQAHARNFAQNGFVVLVIETIQRGEVRGSHLGSYEEGRFNWFSRGYNPAGVEVWNGIRGLDLLSARKEVDPERLGVTGKSGGGSQSWYLPAIDERLKAAAAVAGAGSLEGQIKQRTINDHCDCMMPINTYLIDFSDIGALIAPRAFMIAQTDRDEYYSIESVRDLFHKIRPIYSFYGQANKLLMKEAAGSHSYGDDESLRAEVLSFFLRELQDKEFPATAVGPIATERVLSNEALGVYGEHPPKGDRTTQIQESFVAKARPPKIKTKAELSVYRNKVVSFLQEKTFNAFPKEELPLEIHQTFRGIKSNGMHRERYSYTAEKGWRLSLSVRHDSKTTDKEQNQVLVVLRSAEEARYGSEALVRGATKHMDVVFLETRGTGETAWSPSQQWYIRRAAAWTGRTLASMRVYDVLRGLKAIRQLPQYGKGLTLHLAAQGEMAVVAAYASLLDGNVETLLLNNLPETQDMEGDPEGKKLALELLNCLKITDIAQVVGLHYPKQTVLTGPLPKTYNWAEQLYTDLGEKQSFIKTDQLHTWLTQKKAQ